MKCINDLNLKSKKYIIFDLDGTLIDSVDVWNKTDQTIIKRFTGKSLELKQIQNDREEFLANNPGKDSYLGYIRDMIDKYNINMGLSDMIDIRREISTSLLIDTVDFKEGAVELIKLLKSKGYKLILATGTTKVQIDLYSNKNINMSSKLKLIEFFDPILTSEDVINNKPHPEIYLKAMNYYDALPEECVAIEDSLVGVKASTNAGIDTIAVYDYHSQDDYEKIQSIADYYINDLSELLNVVEGWNVKYK